MKPFRTGKWEVHPDLNRIEGPETSHRVPPKLMDVLALLVQRNGTLVPKEELLERVWAGVVVNDLAVSQAVSKLRKLLDDSARAPRFIETISKRGYRFIGPVEDLDARRPGRGPAKRPAASGHGPWRYAALLLAATVIVAALHG